LGCIKERTLALAGLLTRAGGHSKVDGAGGGLVAISDRKLVGNETDDRSMSRCRFLRRDGAPIRCAALHINIIAQLIMITLRTISPIQVLQFNTQLLRTENCVIIEVFFAISLAGLHSGTRRAS